MYTYKLDKLPKTTYEFQVDIPWADVEKEYEKAFNRLHEEFVFEGYRKGKAPKSIAQQHIKKDAIFQHAIRSFVPDIYEEIIKKETIKPIVNPKVELIEAKEKEDWKIKITVAERPEIILETYKKAVHDALAESKTPEIWTPGQGEKPAESKETTDQNKLNIVLDALMKDIKIDIADLIVEDELNQRLSKLVDDVQKVGLTMESYLTSKGLTMETMKSQLTKEIEDTYKLEFILMAIADKENIVVEQKDLEALFANIKDEKERQNAVRNAYFYASIMKKQKTLEFLTSL
ncbi:MAG: trigger factor [Candidatus Roizmanbacteria bacterium]